jgi:hypothetical protein
VHRFGQTRQVTIVDLCVRGSIDEVMKEAVHPSKRRAANQLLRKIPILESSSHGSKHRKPRTIELLGIGSALLPMWQKMISDTNPTKPAIEYETMYTDNTKPQKDIPIACSRKRNPSSTSSPLCSRKRKSSSTSSPLCSLPKIKKKKRKTVA